MPRLLIGSLRLERWYTHDDGGEFAWIPAGDVLADALRDLRPENGTLSVYEIPEPEDRALVRRIVVAVAAGQRKPGDVGFFLFERATVEALAIGVNAVVPGETGDPEVNGLHRDLEQLSAQKLAQLAGVIAQGEDDEVLSKELRTVLDAEIKAKRMAKDKVHPELRKELGLD